MMNSIKEKLIEAGRLDDIVNEISNIKKRINFCTSYPTIPHIELSGEFSNNVSGRMILLGLEATLLKIEECTPAHAFMAESFSEEIEAAKLWVQHEMDCCLHNIAIVISHREVCQEDDIEHARVLLILESVMRKLLDVDNISFPFDVPKGWRSVDSSKIKED